MSFPGRPPILPGVPMYVTAAPMMPAPQLVSGVAMAHMVPIVSGAPQIRALPKLNPNRQKVSEGPTVTVFVGNITERAPDAMVRQVLAACGHVISWKKVKAFGFCELAGPDAGLRAVRLLHDLMVGDKRLVAKVDAKTQAVLDEYKVERRRRHKGSPLQDENEEEELDEETQYLDDLARAKIRQVLRDYEEDMNNYEHKKEEEVMEKWNRVLADAEVEEDKRALITREIGKFREIMKKQEEEKESRKREKEERRERERKTPSRSRSRSRTPKEEKDREIRKEKKKKRSRSRSSPHERSKERETRDKEREREREREKERERELERERQRERDREREKEREREKDREREQRDRERERERERTRERNRDRDGDKLSAREKEIDEEAKEKKKIEKKAREKEAAYQERLRLWETRERRKAKEYERERERDRLKEEDRERDAKRLKEFLEDYDDERDDVKYYKGRELQRRVEARLKEAESDTKDRTREKDEMDEIKKRIYAEEHEDPDAEFEKIRKQREELYKPKLIIDVNLEHWKQKEREKERELERQRARESERKREAERERRHREEREKYVKAQAEQELAAVEAEPIESDSDNDMDNGHFSPPAPEPESFSNENSNSTPAWTQVQAPDEDSRQSFASPPDDPASHLPGSGMKITLSKPISLNNSHSPKQGESRKKKMDLREVFNPDEDDSDTVVKKRKLVPLDYNEEKSKSKHKENGERTEKSEKKEENKSQEEKRKTIKNLIEKIPTEKDKLFAYQLDWTSVDNGLMEKKIRPWINKKIIEYIGEPEPTLVDFICNKVLAGSEPQTILEDVQMVLDEEAEVFVVKMWRLLIYEVEAKKLGLAK